MSPRLDHIVFLVPSIDQAIEAFESRDFSIVRGGTHADGLTENALVILGDGVYIECIAFLPRSKDESEERKEMRERHWWFKRGFGFIDWCLSPGYTGSSVVVKTINDSGQRTHYEQPKAGGRRTAEGVELKWVVSFPTPTVCGPRGRMPFFCEDVPQDSRPLRVPSKVVNPSVVVGLVILTLPGKLDIYKKQLTTVFTAFDPDVETAGPFHFISSDGSSSIELVVREPTNAEERKYVTEQGEGVYECILRDPDRSAGLLEIQSSRFSFTKIE